MSEKKAKHPKTPLQEYCTRTCVSGIIGLERKVEDQFLRPMAVSMMVLSAAEKMVGLLEKSPLLKSFIAKRNRDVLLFESFLFAHGLIVTELLSEPQIWEHPDVESDPMTELMIGSRVVGLRSIEKLAGFGSQMESSKNRVYRDDVAENIRIFSYALYGCKNHPSPPLHVLPQQIEESTFMNILGVAQLYVKSTHSELKNQIVKYIKKHSGTEDANKVLAFNHGG